MNEEILLNEEVQNTNNQENGKKIELTKEGYEDIIRERNQLLKDIEVNKIELQEARAQGDLSENAEYNAARENQAKLNSRLNDLDEIIKNHVIIEKINNNDVVVLASKVTFEDLSEKMDSPYRFQSYTIVGSVEANPNENKISNVSPLGMALFGSRVGDEVEVTGIANEYRIKILKIE